MNQLAWLVERPIAHRGFHDANRSRWENTLAAFDAAAKRGFSIECDVHLTADGEVVVFHDEKLERLTGSQGLVHQKTASEMCALAVGGTVDRVPTLAQMLETVGGRVPIVIELKGVRGHDDGLVAAVARRLSGYEGKAAIMSFNHWLIRQFATEAPGIPGGLTAYGTSMGELEAHHSMLAHPISFVSYDVTALPNPFVTLVRERLGMPVITWTVTDPEGVAATRAYADQMTFERFDPESGRSI